MAVINTPPFESSNYRVLDPQRSNLEVGFNARQYAEYQSQIGA
jgi:hypothetical protein